MLYSLTASEFNAVQDAVEDARVECEDDELISQGVIDKLTIAAQILSSLEESNKT